MSTNGQPREEIDLGRYSENWLKIPCEEFAKYAGQWVAISGDGTHILVGGSDWETAEANLAALGIPGDAVGWTRIPALDEESWL